MNIVIVLISISLAIALVFLGIFFWNVKTGQYDDTESPAMRMLFEEKKKIIQQENKISEPDKNQVTS